ncbi:DAZ-associated protein 1-like [Styela clava]
MPADDEQEEGKIFVGALAGETNEEGLQRYFSKYGEVINTVVMMDKVTLRSRGFGFVTFRDPACVQAVLGSRPHFLDNKKVDPKPCTPKAIQLAKRNALIHHVQTHKIFLGGLAKDATEDDVRQYFHKFGEVTDVELIIDEVDKKHKGFGFVTFQEASAVDEIVRIHFHEIKGRRAEAKRKQPRDKILTGTVRPPHKQNNMPPRDKRDYADAYPPPPPDAMARYGYGYGPPVPQGPSGGWMPGPPAPGPPQSMNNSYYGYSYGPAPSRGGNGNEPYEERRQQWPSSYGPAKAGSYGYDQVGNGYDRKQGGQGYHPYRR